MDRLKKARRPVRAQVTKLVRDIKDLTNQDPVDRSTVQVKFQVLTTIWNDLEEHDSKIIDQLVDDGATDQEQDTEYDAILQYKESYLETKNKVETLVQPSVSPPASDFDTASTSGGARKQRNFKLPKIELRKFDGDLKNWLGWWSQFQKIDEDDDLDEADKIQYLFQSMQVGSEAREIVSSYPQTGDNYKLAVEALKDQFGRKDLLLQVYVRELLTLVISNVTSKERIPLGTLYLKLESHLRSLATLELDKNLLAIVLFPLVESSLSVECLRAWQRSPQSKADGKTMNPPKSRLELLMDFIKGEVQSEQQIELAQSTFSSATPEEGKKANKQRKSRKEEEIATAAGLVSTTQRGGCAFCEKNHDSDRCVTALSMELEARRQKIQEKRLCFQCLKPGHRSKNCKAVVKCAVCSGRHYPIICSKIHSSSKESAPTTGAEKPTDGESTTTMSNAVNHCSSKVLLYTLCVPMVGDGITVTARILGDPGSQRSYIRRATAQKVKCKKIGDEFLRNIVFGGGATVPRKVNKLGVALKTTSGSFMHFELLEEDNICGKTPKVPNGAWIGELAKCGITLSDVGTGYEDVDILLGFDYWGQILTGNMRKLSLGLVATETIFGWMLGGPVPEQRSSVALCTTTSLVSCSQDVTQLWDLEAIGIKDPIETKSEEESQREAMYHFKENIERDDEGRYVVSLPWRESDGVISDQLPTNRKHAEQRLRSVTRKLRNNNKLQDYDKVFTAWKEEGLITEGTDTDEGHYIPHRPVFKNSATTPVRPVFDCSARVGNNPSLNDLLYKGPNLLELIVTLLLRFRKGRIGVSADIRKAFQMLKVTAKDQPYQRFLWWTDETCTRIKVYQHNRVVFGMTCSPFLLAAAIYHHLEQFEGSVEVVEQLKNSFYVDNLVLSVNSKEEYSELHDRSLEIMSAAHMELRQWAHSFSEEFRISPSMNEECRLSSGEDIRNFPLLGIKWNLLDDVLSGEIKDIITTGKVTKRMVLSAVSQIFDPLGFLSPATLIPKLILQEAWIAKLGWDDPLPEPMLVKYEKWKNEITSLNEMKLPRHCQLPGNCEKEIHVYCDSSKYASACVIYLRSEICGKVQTRLLLAKSRVAPIKKASIPRLELVACLLGVRLASQVKKAFLPEDIPTYFWSDSTTALAWIRRDAVWGVFVMRRVKEIRLFSEPNQWSHVAGVHNPADLPSRGCSPKQLLESNWLDGPTWLKLPREQWPMSSESVNEEEVNGERRVTSLTVTSLVTQPTFNNYRKNVAVWGWVLRFITKSRKKSVQNSKWLSIGEMRRAEKIIIRQIQEESFPCDPTQINGIYVLKDDERILRVKTRLSNRNDLKDFIFPILLPKEHPHVALLIEDAHKIYCHAGIQCLATKIREKYWILQSRRTIRSIIKRCVRCKRHEASAVKVNPAPLPELRVKTSEAFETVGVDLCGPITLKDGSKSWIVIFTCAVYRGVYLDLVSSLSTEAFLGALERCIGWCGRPNTIYSDNGTNFVGAVNLFKQLDWKLIEEKTRVKQIQWIFNPPTAAWWGGWWERLVRSVKGLLKRILGTSRLSLDEMRTCLSGVAATINDRPLTAITEDNGDLHPLTPNMFMRGKMAGYFPETEDYAGMSAAYQKMKQYQQQMQARFRREYLSQLVMKGNEQKQTVRVGDIVLIGSDNKKRFEWPLGVITELITGKDGHIRVARLKTQQGILLRPLQRLYPLEIPRGNELACGVEKPAIKTRTGRIVKEPSKYGQWLHLVSY